MSTDLQLLRDLPKLRLRAVDPSPPPEFSASAASTSSEGSNSDAVHPEERRDGDDGCRTPTSEKNRIPQIQTCPPAPKKPRLALSCKRKLSELEFFEILDHAEIDDFFRTASEKIASNEAPKRKRFSERIAA